MQSVLPPSYHVDSLWHQMDARWKLVAVILALFMLPWLNSLPMALTAFLSSLLLLASAQIPFTWWRDRLLAVGLFLLLFVVVLPFTVGQLTWEWAGIGISQRGLVLALVILFKSLAALSLTLFLIGTTTFETLLHAATRLGTPRPILRVLLITWRYVRIMYDTIEHFRIALRLRGFRNRVGWETYRTISSVVGTLLVLGFEHTERVSQAMRCRGYHGRVETLQEFQTTRTDILLFGLITGSMLVLLCLALKYP
jgi:cobalt/nickel transport system permease protein